MAKRDMKPRARAWEPYETRCRCADEQTAQSGQGWVARADQRTHHRVLHHARRRFVLVGRAAGQEMTLRWTTHGSIHVATRPELGASSTIDGRATGLSREAVSTRIEHRS